MPYFTFHACTIEITEGHINAAYDTCSPLQLALEDFLQIHASGNFVVRDRVVDFYQHDERTFVRVSIPCALQGIQKEFLATGFAEPASASMAIPIRT